MLVHCRVTPGNKIRCYPFIHLGGGWHCKSSVFIKNTTQCPRPGLEPGLLDPETSALAMRPPRLPQQQWQQVMPKNVFLNYFANPHVTSRVHGKQCYIQVWGFKILKLCSGETLDFVAILMIKSFQFVESTYAFWICLYQFFSCSCISAKIIETKIFFFKLNNLFFSLMWK